jgi:TPR repeat protein
VGLIRRIAVGGCIVAAGACVGGASAQEERRYPLAEHGHFVLRVPAGWRDSIGRTEPNLPPTILLRPASGPVFQVLVTPIWPMKPGIAAPTLEELKASVLRAAEGVKSQAVESAFEAIELKGQAARGYYFKATDRAPKPGEFKYLSQGMLNVGELRVTFSILTNDGQDAAVKSALDMLRGARHAPPGAAAQRGQPSLPASAQEVSRLISAGDFKSAEARLNKLQRAFAKDYRQEEALGDALYACYQPGDELRAALDRWVAGRPGSYAARLCRGMHWTATGFERRGEKAMAQTTLAQVVGMRNAFDAAFLDYRRALELDPKPTFAYWGLITIGRALGVEKRALDGLLQEALALEPLTSNVRLAYLGALAPQWGGSAAEMEAFVRETRNRYPQVRKLQLMEANVASAKALEARRAGDVAGAVRESDNAVQLAKGERTLRDRAWAHFMAKNYDQAIADANEAMKLEDCHPCALAIRGMANVRSGRHKEGLEDLHTAALENNATAQTELGMAYAFGRYGVTRDYSAAEKHCRKAAEQRDSLGAYCLGGLYLSGAGVPKDAAQAARWFELAALLGVADAQADLGAMYARGMGVPQDKDAAVKWLTLAAKQGNARAMGELQKLQR